MFSVYGPGQPLDNPYQGVLGIFLGSMLTKKPIAIYGDGEQTRDFVYIDDVVDAWVKVLTNPASFGEVYNIGSGHSMSINELAKRVIKSI
jgi:UDP-glucose 4-epimerase